METKAKAVKVVSAKPTPFWDLRISVAEEIAKRFPDEPAFTREDIGKAYDWVDCACGKQDPRIPRYSQEEWLRLEKTHPNNNKYTNAPKDRVLFNLGMQFAEAVENDEVSVARIILDKIERRSALLLLRIKDGKKK